MYVCIEKKKGEEVGKGEWEAKDLHRPNKTKREERDYTYEALELFNHLQPLMNLCRALCRLSTQNSNPQRIPCQGAHRYIPCNSRAGICSRSSLAT